MLIPKFEIGQTVWVARTTRRAAHVVCPVCFGKKVVTLELGDGSRIEMDCDYCSKGYEAPTGYVDGDWSWEPRIEGPYTIVGVRTEVDEDETEIMYWTRTPENSKIGFSEDKVAVTQEGAERLAREMAIRQQEKELKDEREKKEKPHKSYSWHVGYHLRKAAQASAEYTRHTEKAKFMESKVRKPKEV